jgi:hypothetical protein
VPLITKLLQAGTSGRADKVQAQPSKEPKGREEERPTDSGYLKPVGTKLRSNRRDNSRSPSGKINGNEGEYNGVRNAV